MFIEQGFKGRHESWRYLLGTLIIFFSWMFIGQLPLSIVILSKTFSGSEPIDATPKGIMEAANLSSNLFIFLMLFAFIFGCLAIYIVVKFLHKQNFKTIFTARKKIGWNRFFFSFILVGVYIIISTIISYYANPEDFEVQFTLKPFLVLLVISVLLVPIQVAFEELLFRGYLMQGFGVIAKNKWFPLLMTSVIFGGLHIMNPEVSQFGMGIMTYYIGTGLFLGIIALMDDGLELSLGFHTANNLIQILLVTANWSAFQSESILKDLTDPTGMGSEIITAMLVFYPIMLLIFARVYKWTDWKEKLFGKVCSPEHQSLENN